MTAGSGSSGSRRRSGRGKVVLFFLLLIFGGGFYSGVYATKRVIASDSGILRRVFGIQAPAPAPPVATTQPAPLPVAAPVTVPPASTVQAAIPQTTTPVLSAATKPSATVADTPKPTQPDSGATSSSTAPDADQTPAPTTHGPATQETSDDQALLTKQVDDYNDMLHRIQDALRHYAVIHQKSADSKTPAKDIKILLDQENKLFNEIGQSAKHAENVQDAIRANSNYARLYMEGSICAARKDIPTKLLDLDLDKLKFIDKAP